jgi:hypothetical protein
MITPCSFAAGFEKCFKRDNDPGAPQPGVFCLSLAWFGRKIFNHGDSPLFNEFPNGAGRDTKKGVPKDKARSSKEYQ